MRTCIVAIAGALLLVAGAGCPREPMLRLLHNQGAYGVSGSYSELNAGVLYGFSQLGDDFELEEGRSTITYIRWWGAYRDNTAGVDDFSIFVFADNGAGAPDMDDYFELEPTTVSREMTDDLFSPDNWRLNIYEYSVTLPDAWEVEPGERYFLVIMNDTGQWLWSNNPTQGNHFGVSRAAASEGYLSNGVDLAFQIWGH